MKWYLGTNFGHGSAAAAIDEDGVLRFSVEEGRLIGEKATARFPSRSIELAIDALGSLPARWAEGWAPLRRLMLKGVGTTLRYGVRDRSYYEERLARESRRFFSFFREVWRSYGRLGFPRFTGHHLAHSLSLVPWGLRPGSLVLVSDYTAEAESVSSFHWNGCRMKSVTRSLFPHSLGAAYHQAAVHVGFSGRTGPGKLMALSGYGEPRWRDAMHDIGRVETGRLVIDQRKLPIWWRRHAWMRYAAMHPDRQLRRAFLDARLAQERAVDFAASVQSWFSDLTWDCIVSNVAVARATMGLGVCHLALVGGAALNCAANGVVLHRMDSIGLESLTVCPWSDDCGTAIGAAVMLALDAGCREFMQCGPFLGPRATDSIDRPAHVSLGALQQAVNALLNGEIIALASGRLEFGPRALGGRCLLADPRAPWIKERLNCMKRRFSFMPFAPVFLKEESQDFVQRPASTNMAWTVPLKPEIPRLLRGLAHPTGETRAQILGVDDAPLLRRVISEFRRRTGYGILLLTSLNTADESIPTFLRDALDVCRRLGVFGIIHDGGWTPISEQSPGLLRARSFGLEPRRTLDLLTLRPIAGTSPSEPNREESPAY